MADIRRKVTILGATGSIGISTLEVISLNQSTFNVFALTANSNVEKMLEQCLATKPRFAVMRNDEAAAKLSELLKQNQILGTEVLSGDAGLSHVASHGDVDDVVAAIVGGAGLKPTMAAVEAGKKILLANKESLVMSGRLFMEAVAKNEATLLPVDSEHNAIFQSMPANYRGDFSQHGIEKILLTASGGPFRNKTKAELAEVTPSQAVAHPNWSMGAKISVDSATLMNKGLELIEACFLFNCAAEQIQVVVHPQSVIHSMVQYCDGSVIAELGQPDMRTPIAYGMAWPERIDAGVKPLDLFAIARLDFTEPDHETFPCLNLAKEAFERGGICPAVLNAANEIAVAAFLAEQISFLAIPELIKKVMGECPDKNVQCLEDVLAADQWSRNKTNDALTEFKNKFQPVNQV